MPLFSKKEVNFDKCRQCQGSPGMEQLIAKWSCMVMGGTRAIFKAVLVNFSVVVRDKKEFHRHLLSAAGPWKQERFDGAKAT